MRSYGQYCPIAHGAEILATRWTPLVVRELLTGASRFNDLMRGLPGISRSLLSERLRLLERAGIVTRTPAANGRGTEYQLTLAGQALEPVIDSLGRWGARWTFGEPRAAELDPVLLLWWMRRRLDFERVPNRRVVVRFVFPDVKRRRTHWLVLENQEASVCLVDPGETDLTVTSPIASFYRVWLGRLPLTEAMRSGDLRIEGPRELVRSFPTWLKLSHLAGPVREAMKVGT